MLVSIASMPAAGDVSSLWEQHTALPKLWLPVQKTGRCGSPLRQCAKFHAADDCTPRWSCKRWLDERLQWEFTALLWCLKERGLFLETTDPSSSFLFIGGYKKLPCQRSLGIAAGKDKVQHLLKCNTFQFSSCTSEDGALLSFLQNYAGHKPRKMTNKTTKCMLSCGRKRYLYHSIKGINYLHRVHSLPFSHC